MEKGVLPQGDTEDEALATARSPGPDILAQPHGVLLVFERPDLTLSLASETLPRLFQISLPAAFGAPLESLLDGALAPRVRALGSTAEERRNVQIAAGNFSVRLLGLPDALLVELEPAIEDEDTDALGAILDDAAVALSDTASLADVGRISCTKFAEATGFTLVALTRATADDGIQILGEVHDATLPSLFGRAGSAEALLNLVPAGGSAVVADLRAAPARILALHEGSAAETALVRAELTLPDTALLASPRADGVVALAVLPIEVGGRVWGHFLAEHREPHRFGHHQRRFVGALGQMTAAAADRVQQHARVRARRLASEAVTAFEATVADGITTSLDALLFGDRLLPATAGADGVAVLCARDCAVIGQAPDPDALLAKLPALLRGTTAVFTTDQLGELGGFSAPELAGTGSMMAIQLAESPFIALAAFRHQQDIDDRVVSGSWEPHRMEAFSAVAKAFRRTLLLGDDAAAAELSSQMGEFEQNAFGAGRLRSAVMASSTTGMALIAGQSPGRLSLVECNPMFRRLFGLDPRELPDGGPDELARKLSLSPPMLSDSGQAAAEVELWSAELGPRIVEIDTKAIVRTRLSGVARDLALVQATDLTRIRRQEVAMRMARDQALALIKSRDELLANMSHELRTPLNAVIGFAELISNQALGPLSEPRYVGYGRDIETAGRHLLSLINDILDLSRLASGRQLQAEETVDLVALARSCVDWAHAASPHKRLTLTVDGDGESETVWLSCDERAIRQILINLISNAVKFTGEDGTVGVRVHWRPKEAVAVEVVDDGIGMSPSELARAFEPFFRGGGAYRRRIEGAGLGLAIARGLMELHGGSLALTSLERRGTTARLELPAWRIVSQTGSPN